jgi:cyclopropane-fatty-acyl-phospholipid synthase
MAESLQARRAHYLEAIFKGYDGPAVGIRLWDGWQWSCSSAGDPVCTIAVGNPEALAALATRPSEITLGEAFLCGDLDVEGDIFSVFAVAEHLLNRPRALRQQIVERAARAAFAGVEWFRHGALHSKKRDRASIEFHYDQPVEFFRPWLGRTLVYSCAYFHSDSDTIDTAQEQKLELICQKLRLKPGERFLDIGCGWGGLILHAAAHHGVRAQGITLSRTQAEIATRRIGQARLADGCRAELRDYRDLEHEREPFDKIASVGMFEHVGLKNLRLYFRIARALLRPGGVFLNHAIARCTTAPIRKDSFIAKYVFPGGHLVTLNEAIGAAESQGLEVRDVENLREHYERTLHRWVEGLRRNESALLKVVPKATYRTWLLYMAGSAAAFRRGDIAVYQTLLSRPNRGQSGLPLTRADWYEAKPAEEPSHVSAD